ncbi:MAG TPA: 3-phosphoshikimate 1-carboxyvinyltransferase [Frankiaceae bacterium]|nr:3-phosphoshikimate 1-carboxyvinyltransferase [Frankiaceae bacterium]
MPWNAPVATAPVDAVVRLPGSKSVTNRALLLGSLARGTTAVRAPLKARDTLLMAGALRALGASVEESGDDWLVSAGEAPTAARIDLGNAGTVARFVPAVAALKRGTYAFDGDPRLRERPIGPLLAALRTLGADVSGESFPLVVHGRGELRGGAVTVDASKSSQLVSGLLLAAPLMAEGLDLTHSGERVPSRPHLDMTVAMMRSFGASVTVSDDRWVVAPGTYDATDVEVEPDLSGAAPFVAAAVVTGGVVRIPGWPLATTQPGAALVGLAERLGAMCTLDASGLTVRGPSTVRAIDADLADCGELAPVLAAVACVAGGATTLRGIGHLRVQETDRLAALATELRGFGVSVEEAPAALTISPEPLRPSGFRTYDDHRLAMAAAVLGLVVPVEVENVETVAKTMPDFVDRWLAMLA